MSGQVVGPDWSAWIAIVREFVPEHLRRRVFAGIHAIWDVYHFQVIEEVKRMDPKQKSDGTRNTRAQTPEPEPTAESLETMVLDPEEPDERIGLEPGEARIVPEPAVIPTPVTVTRDRISQILFGRPGSKERAGKAPGIGREATEPLPEGA